MYRKQHFLGLASRYVPNSIGIISIYYFLFEVKVTVFQTGQDFFFLLKLF